MFYDWWTEDEASGEETGPNTHRLDQDLREGNDGDSLDPQRNSVYCSGGEGRMRSGVDGESRESKRLVLESAAAAAPVSSSPDPESARTESGRVGSSQWLELQHSRMTGVRKTSRTRTLDLRAALSLSLPSLQKRNPDQPKTGSLLLLSSLDLFFPTSTWIMDRV